MLHLIVCMVLLEQFYTLAFEKSNCLLLDWFDLFTKWKHWPCIRFLKEYSTSNCPPYLNFSYLQPQVCVPFPLQSLYLSHWVAQLSILCNEPSKTVYHSKYIGSITESNASRAKSGWYQLYKLIRVVTAGMEPMFSKLVCCFKKQYCTEIHSKLYSIWKSTLCPDQVCPAIRYDKHSLSEN